MQVIATAGHVDHGKSTLVHALTGSDPDRLAEEHRRGLTIELGYCWMSLDGVGEVAFVDVPGHERFLPTMLAGVGPVPAVMFVVAADDLWMPQADEHLAALDALGVAEGVLVITRSDLAEPEPALRRAREQLAGTSLAGIPAVAVSARTGTGMGELRAVLASVAARLPQPDAEADVRLWIDRRFHVAGAGTVVTGTLPAGTLRRGDQLAFGDDLVRVRGLQSLERDAESVAGVARVALNLGNAPPGLDRGGVLVSPDRWLWTTVVDVRVSTPDATLLPRRPVLHIGAAATGTHARVLGEDLVRLTLDRALPLRVGDRAVVRDPGSRALWGITVLDPLPPRLARRGAAQVRAKSLATATGRPDLDEEVRRRRVVAASMLRKLGVEVPPGADGTATAGVVRRGDWLLDERVVPELVERLRQLVAARAEVSPLDPSLTTGAAARALDLPGVELVPLLVSPPLVLEGGSIHHLSASSLPPHLSTAVSELEAQLAESPFAAPDAGRLAALGLDRKALGAATRAGRLLRVAENIVLLPDALERASSVLGALPQPFTVSEARVALGTTRRVVLPLLELMDRRGLTQRHPDDRRTFLPR